MIQRRPTGTLNAAIHRWRDTSAVFLMLSAITGVAHADAASDARARCATRISITLTGSAPTPDLAAAPSPQSMVDTILASPAFIERFSRFVNSVYNDEPGTLPAEDAAYWLSKEIVSKKLPWKDMFLGNYKVDVAPGAKPDSTAVQVTADPQGLGYFRSNPWLLRYAGNELTGLKLTTANRIMHNVIGLRLAAVTNPPGADVSAAGRAAAPCNQCHFDTVFALDKVASILSTKNVQGNQTTFGPQRAASAAVLGGTVTDDKSLVERLVNSDSFKFASCRLAFQYLYGRAENKCEGALFDKCVAAFTQAGTMQSALSTIATDATFCQ